MQQLDLQTYSIFIGNFWVAFQQFLAERQYPKIAIIVDENTRQYCLPFLQKKLPNLIFSLIEIPAGERHKSIETGQFIWSKMMNMNLGRDALIINLGGGVIGDMGGFCAATFKRGMDFIQIPTTLLSQVDASIGGKLGIDFQHIKNSIGVFQNPQAVFIDPEFLRTLPFREIRSGFAEIIKHSLIADATQWEKLQTIKNLESVQWEDFLKPALTIKKNIVESDPFEKDARKALNFGHTIGHAIESWALQSASPLLHGEAVAFGMVCEAWLSHQVLGLSKESLKKIIQFIHCIYGTYSLEQEVFPQLIALMKNDKKNEGTGINFTLIDSIGHFHINQVCAPKLIIESLKILK